jgi:transposase
MMIEGAMNGEIFLAYVQQVLVPALRRNDIVVLDDYAAHKVAGVEEAIEQAGATVRYLPRYSPDLNPIEMPYSKFKAMLRKAAGGIVRDLYGRFARLSRSSVLENVPTTLSMPAMFPYEREPI